MIGFSSKLLFVLLTTAAASCLIIPATIPLAAQNIITLDDLRSGISQKWKEKKFKGSTRYTLSKTDNKTSIAAESDQAASGLFYKIDYLPSQFPLLEWSWKIDAVIESGDARLKEGDDYAARVYVVFPNIFFWRTKALNYIWANKLPKGELCPNAYTANNMMIAVESGNQLAGQWVTEQRNIINDYQLAFGEPPPNVGAIAIMSDTDNTGEHTRAWYGPIKIKSLY